MKKKIVSIVILSYNEEEYIVECLESVFDQTYSHIELIISDDASTDNTVNEIDRWIVEKKYRFEKVIVIKNLENNGISANHSIGVGKASGEYIKYLGGDDVLSPYAIELLLEFALKNNFSWVQCLIQPFYLQNDKKMELQILPKQSELKKFKKNSFQQQKLLGISNFICAPGVFIKKSILEEINYFGTDIKSFEDWHTWLNLTNRKYCIRLLDMPLVYWRRHEKAVSFSAFSTSNWQWIVDMMTVINSFIIPNLGKSQILIRKHNLVELEYYGALLDDPSGKINHQKHRFILLKDPLWWFKRGKDLYWKGHIQLQVTTQVGEHRSLT